MRSGDGIHDVPVIEVFETKLINSFVHVSKLRMGCPTSRSTRFVRLCSIAKSQAARARLELTKLS